MPAPWCGPYSLGRTLKPEREAGTAGVAVLNRNARHMRVGNAPYDCKAEARASRLTAIMTPKTTKQKFALVLVYSRTLIKDPNGSIRSHHELNNRSPRGMMNCILDKIANCSVHQVWIAFDPYRFRRRIETDFFALGNHQGRRRVRRPPRLAPLTAAVPRPSITHSERR